MADTSDPEIIRLRRLCTIHQHRAMGGGVLTGPELDAEADRIAGEYVAWIRDAELDDTAIEHVSAFIEHGLALAGIATDDTEAAAALAGHAAASTQR